MSNEHTINLTHSLDGRLLKTFGLLAAALPISAVKQVCVLAAVSLVSVMASQASFSASNAIDLNHDGKTDLFWQNVQTGDTSAWLMNGSQTPQYGIYANVPISSGWSLREVGDFNGDGKTDLFWYNVQTGDTSAWLMNGSQTPQYAIYANVPISSGWSLREVGDFNGDGKTDLFWYNFKTGDTSAWLMNGSQTPQYAIYANVPISSGWSLQGVGDFNGDGKTDLFWYNVQTGDTSAWLMNGSQTPQYAIYANVPVSSGWTLPGVGDFNGDGKTDLFWYNVQTGDTSAWLMNGSQTPQYAIYANVPVSSGWTLPGVGDFNGDGKTDLLWRNLKTGDTSAWLMNGSQTPQYAIYANVPLSSGWSLQGVGDFNGDGKTDLFWYNFKTGDTSAWLMNGSQTPQYAIYANVPISSGWGVRVVGLRLVGDVR